MVHLLYFGSFPILIRVFCCISIFTILFSNFSSLFSTLFITFNISSINIYIFLDSILYNFFFFLQFGPFLRESNI